MKTDSGSDLRLPYEEEPDVVETLPRGWSAWFGGPNTAIGRRIAPRIAPVAGESAAAAADDDSDSGLSSNAILEKQLAEEAGHAIQYRTCSWQKTAALLFSEYICLVRTYCLLGHNPSLFYRGPRHW
jgi:hypothetical protein